jgi:hypothetical protein
MADMITLTREEAQQVLDSSDSENPDVQLRAAITLRARLAEPEKEQEPVAWMYPDDCERMQTSETFCTVFSVPVGHPTQGKSTVALYTAPPQREFVGLTDEEIEELASKCWFGGVSHGQEKFARAIEAKLKEKNQ